MKHIGHSLSGIISDMRGGAEPVAADTLGEKTRSVGGGRKHRHDQMADDQVARSKAQAAVAADSPRKVWSQGLFAARYAKIIEEKIFIDQFGQYANTLLNAVIIENPRAGDPTYAEVKVCRDGKMSRDFTCPQCGRQALTAARWKKRWNAQCWKCPGNKPARRLDRRNIMSWNVNRTLGPCDASDNLAYAKLEECMAMYVPPTPASEFALMSETDVRLAQLKFNFLGYGKSPRLWMVRQLLSILNCRASAVIILAIKKGVPTTPTALGRYLIAEGMTTTGGEVPCEEYARNLARELLDIGAVEQANAPRGDSGGGTDKWAMTFLKKFADVTISLCDLVTVLWANVHHIRGEQKSFPYNPKEKIPTRYRIRNIRSWFPKMGASFQVKKSTLANKGRGNYWRVSFKYVIEYINERVAYLNENRPPPATAPPAQSAE